MAANTTGQTIQFVKRSRAFAAKALLRAAGVGASATYRPSDVIYSQGDVAESVLYVQEGFVKLSVTSHSGKEGVVAMLEAGHFFGESALAGRPARLETATAVTDTTLLITPKAPRTARCRRRLTEA